PFRHPGQPAARQAGDGGDRARSRRRSVAAVARRTGGGPALPREAGTRRSVAVAAARGDDDIAGGARHGGRHGPDRPPDRDGFRREAGRGPAGSDPARPAGTRGLSGWRRVSASPANVLDVERLPVAYGKVLAVRDVSLAVAPGSIVTVIGPNGAGKTTLLGAIAGLLPAHGALRCFGANAMAWPVEERVARGIVLVPEKRELFASMSVADHLLLGGFARRRERTVAAALDDVYGRFPRLAERRAQLAGTLSGG